MWLFRRAEIRCDCVIDAFFKGDRIVLAFEKTRLSLSQDAARMTLALLKELFEDDHPNTGGGR
jgi:hypothetical protein